TVSAQASPRPLHNVSLDLKGLYRNSPVAFAGCLLIGVANGAWGTLGAVYGARIGISTAEIALMMSIAVIAGAALQMPAGRLSDRTDRRFVLAGASGGAAVIGLAIFLLAARSGTVVIALTAAYGALAYTLYSIAVAHANDHADAEDFVKVSGGLLLLYGFGTMIGPVLGAVLMAAWRPESLFIATGLAHLALAGYTMLRVSRRAPIPVEERETFTSHPSERALTPEGLHLDPRSEAGAEAEAEAEAGAEAAAEAESGAGAAGEAKAEAEAESQAQADADTQAAITEGGPPTPGALFSLPSRPRTPLAHRRAPRSPGSAAPARSRPRAACPSRPGAGSSSPRAGLAPP
ncbi:MAG: MFS transporter, partial [Sandaracinaceae bacterium]